MSRAESKPEPSKNFAQFMTQSPIHSNPTNILGQLTANFSQIFTLIDSLVPLQDCLSHKILPLKLTDNCLTLGMVNLENQDGLERVCSLCASKDYNIQPQAIELKTYQSTLLAYSQHNLRRKSIAANSSPIVQELPTLIIDSPLELDLDRSQHPQPVSKQKTAPELNAKKPSKIIPELSVRAYYPSASAGFLATLPAKVLWQELLARLLQSGIGRLYLKSLPTCSCILCLQNGYPMLSIDSLAPKNFQEVLTQLKNLVSLPLVPVKQTRQGQIECSYQNERLLLRWRISPGEQGEEATLQVLRGKALELYQQRQMDELGEQALTLAKQLKLKLDQILDSRTINPSCVSHLSALRQTQELINQQLNLLE
jgi:type II secretory ATPase GspE/PulE/Tfp pilus assembly ATPase PilB-like protein